MAGLILIALVIVLVIGGMIAFSNGVKFWKILVAFVVILGSYHLYVSHTCGPNSKDVKVMKPMAEKIADYIVKNGIPKSLKDIPGLPYELGECSSPQGNVEDCYFYNNEAKYFLRLYVMAESLSMKIKNTATKTGMYISLRKNNQKSKWFFAKEKSFSSKKTGICSPMRQ